MKLTISRIVVSTSDVYIYYIYNTFVFARLINVKTRRTSDNFNFLQKKETIRYSEKKQNYAQDAIKGFHELESFWSDVEESSDDCNIIASGLKKSIIGW